MISYRENHPLDPADVARVFKASGIKRPDDDLARIQKMFTHANLVFSAWDGETLVAISRALTDFSYCCYLSDLAVDARYQRQGIGEELLRLTRQKIGDQVSLILMSAPDAMDYYPALGFTLADNAYVIRRRA
jgi:ribosomal protein S18 acetylase RimI-like enzyme